MADEPSLPDPTSATFTPICAIGASAGGVAALQTLFRQLPTDLGLAYVVIVHLSPDQPSALGEVLSACTRMSVNQVTDGPALKPNCVYVIAPDRELVIEGDRISSRPFSEPRGRRAPIDLFFRSIAKARGDGVAMVLSGSGADGAVGVRSIKEAGGVVMVQEPGEAEFPSMPQNAIATGAVDFVAPLSRLVERLREVAHSKDAVRSLDMDEAGNDVRRIVAFLRARTGHDFSSYKRATVVRRVTRRMQVARLDSLGAYADYLQNTPEEAKELFSDLLISVTQFFRDPRAFEALAQRAIRPILDDQAEHDGAEGIRAWVVGCATGEEAYSLAMLFLEACEQHKLQVPLQIFATDLDEGALATAREGRYPKSIEGDVSEERLQRFFVDEGSHYRVRKEVRETVLFAHHSVLKEPPFMRLDLVSCRNLLIYLERSLQQQLCSVFHYGLKEGRFLFLGSAETADTSGDEFGSLDRDARIYASRPQAVRAPPLLPQFPTPERYAPPPRPVAVAPEHVHSAASTLHAGALEQAAPPSALVDSSQVVLNLSPTAGRFILHSEGPVTNLLPAMVRPELRLDLKLALTAALEQGAITLTHPVVVAFDGERRRVAMQALPVPGRSKEGAQALVFFLDSGLVPPDEAEVAASESRPEEVRRLHAELKSAQEALVASRTGHDTTIQELRAANEELQSTNEEYRSTAEELETSREELQSINEELHTVNAELKSKLEHLSGAHNDLLNLTAATEIGTLFLDGELRIKMFTPPVEAVFNITRFDVGRSITDFTHKLDDPALVDAVRQVLRELTSLEREVHDRNGRGYVLRIRPYRTVEDRIEGVVLTFVDITARLTMETALGRSAQEFRALVRASSQVLYRMSPDWSEMRELFGGGFLAPIEEPNQSWVDLYIPDEDRPHVREVIQEAIAAKSIFDLEHRVVRADGSIGWTHSRAIPILNAEGEIAEWFGSAADVTLQRRAQGALRESEERMRVLVEGVPQLVWRAEGGGRWTWSSPQWRRYTGLSELESRGLGWLAAVHPDDRDAVMTTWHEAASAHMFEIECRLRHVERPGYRWFRGQAKALLDGAGRTAEWRTIFWWVKRRWRGAEDMTNADLETLPSKLLPVTARLAAAGASFARLAPSLRAAASRVEVLEAKTLLQNENERMRRPRYILSGWAYRFTQFADGRRQIYDVILPGEGVGVCVQPRPLALTSVAALTRVELISAVDIVGPHALALDPELARAQEALSALHEHRMFANLARLGRMSALERFAHLLLQLHGRLIVIGAVEKDSFALPLSQEMLGDLLGLSTVHVNRTVQELRRQKLISIDRNVVHLLDRAALDRLVPSTPAMEERAIA